MTAGLTSAATFDFLGFSPDSSSKSFTVDGISVTVTTGTFGDEAGSDIDFDARLVDQGTARGLGSVGDADFKQIDGKNGNDVVVFTFDRLVSIETAFLNKIDRRDKFAFGTVESGAFNRIVDRQVATETVDFTGAFGTVTGTSFGIGAIGNRHNFSIASLSVFDATPTPIAPQLAVTSAFAPSSVPLPAAGLFLLAGIGGLAVATRKKR